MNVSVRPFQPADGPELLDIYFDAVRNGTHRHYSAEQAAAWAPDLPPLDSDETRAWTRRIAATTCFVATSGPDPVGFMSLTNDGHIDLAFVRPRWMGGDVAAHLYDHLLERARATGLTRLSCDASHLFRRFLKRRGWQGDQPEHIQRQGVTLTRWPMFLNI